MEKSGIAIACNFAARDEKLKANAFHKRSCVFIAVNILAFVAAMFVMLYFFYPTDSVYTRNTFHHHNHRHRFGKLGNRPPYNEKAKMARYIVHESSWGVLTTICTHNKGYPWGEVVSIADGLENNSTGIPLIYISVLDAASKDLEINPMASFTFSEAESDWCRQHSIDPEDPRCSRIHLFGKIVKLTPDEIPAAKTAMFTKHPVMEKWPPSHEFYFAKMELTKVEVLDFFGPLSEVSVDEYLNAKI